MGYRRGGAGGGWHAVALSIVATAAAIAFAHVVTIATEAERRCYESLDLSTPGAVCSNGLAWVAQVVVIGGLGVMIGIPLALGVRVLMERGRRARLAGRAMALLPVIALTAMVAADGLTRTASFQAYLLDDVLGAFVPILLALSPVWYFASRGRPAASKVNEGDVSSVRYAASDRDLQT